MSGHSPEPRRRRGGKSGLAGRAGPAEHAPDPAGGLQGRRPSGVQGAVTGSRAVAFAALAGLAIFAHTLFYPFIWDDETIVLENQQIEHLSNVPAIFTSHVFAGGQAALGVAGVAEYYRPAWILSLAIDHALWNERAPGYHLTNNAVHAMTSGLVAWILFQLSGSAWAALGAGVLFAVHPVHAEAVSWVSARNELLLGLFVLGAFSAYLGLKSGGGRVAAVWCGAAFVVALLCKETAVVFPALVLLYEATRGRGASERGVEATRAAPRGLSWRGPLALGALTLAFWLIRSRIVAPMPVTENLSTRLATGPGLVLEYLRLLVLPIGLRVFHVHEPVTSLGSVRFLLPAVLLIVIVALVVRLRRRHPDVALGIGWTLLALAPMSGIAGLLKPTPLAERYLYLPSFGWALIVGSLIARAAAADVADPKRKLPSWMVAPGLGAVVLAALTVAHSRSWRTEIAFMTRLTREAPQVPIGHDALGLIHRREGRWQEAAQAFTTAARLEPGDPRYHFHLGDALDHLGRLETAAQAFETAIGLGIRYPEAHYELGWVYERQGKLEQAAAQYLAAAAMDSGYSEALGAAGQVFTRMGRTEDAERSFRAALRIRPDDPRHHQNLGALYIGTGRPLAAIPELREAIRLDPRRAEAHLALAAALLAVRRPTDAESWVRSGIALAPLSGRARLLLGQVLAAQGRREEAATEFREAARLAGGDEGLRLAAARELGRTPAGP